MIRAWREATRAECLFTGWLVGFVIGAGTVCVAWRIPLAGS